MFGLHGARRTRSMMAATRHNPPKKIVKKAVKPAKKPVAKVKARPPKAPPPPLKRNPTRAELAADMRKMKEREFKKKAYRNPVPDLPGADFIPQLPADWDRSRRVRAVLEHFWDLAPEEVIDKRPRTLGQAVARSAFVKATTGDMRAAIFIRDTLGEMPTQKIDQRNQLLGANGEPIDGIDVAFLPSRQTQYNIPQDSNEVSYGADDGEPGDATEA